MGYLVSLNTVARILAVDCPFVMVGSLGLAKAAGVPSMTKSYQGPRIWPGRETHCTIFQLLDDIVQSICDIH